MLGPSTGAAQSARPSLQDSFRLGSGGGVLCRAQNNSADKAIAGMFDRAWTIVCRDAARPIGQLYGFRDGALARLAAARSEQVTCGAESSGTIEGLGTVGVTECTLAAANVGYRIYRYNDGKITWFAQGLAGYDSALQLGLRTVVADRIVPGEIAVATTGVADPAAFARVQAGTLDPAQTLAEGYRRNNSGDYAEAAEFFDTLQQRLAAEDAVVEAKDSASREERLNEYLVNRALQRSNLGEFAEADALFKQADRIATLDPVQTRLRRNFEALHLINQRKLDDAKAVLARPVVATGEIVQANNGTIELGEQIAAEINSGLRTGPGLGATQSTSLTPEERAAILDAQALHLDGTILRLGGKPTEGRAQLERGLAQANAIRDGRVTSIARLRSQIMAEIALSHEDQGNYSQAEAVLRDALTLLSTSYPETQAMNGARARMAAFLARRGKRDEALALYRDVVKSATDNREAATGLANQLAPYFALLADLAPSRPELVEDMFLASQTLVRPGVADTQAILARELRDSGNESSRLFRQSITLSRDIERGRMELARLQRVESPDASVRQLIAARQTEVAALAAQQAATQAQLSAFPQYRALSTDAMTLAELRAALRPGEGYYKLVVVGRQVYAIYADADGATGFRVPISATTLEAKVAGLRDTISIEEGGQRVTYPFDVKLAHSLYTDLFAPVENRLVNAQHLIFEPDGAMLQLPANLLVADAAGVDTYLRRAADPEADAFDFRGIEWLGRKHAVSTAVSARNFRDARQTPASRASRQYLGFGQNNPIPGAVLQASAARGPGGPGGLDCTWPLSEWNKPIAASELRTAASQIGGGSADIVTGSAFTDTAIQARGDLADFRILHFATHGLVTAPRPECPARPALLTSFGDQGSDGLLSFREIYDLKLDADLVILSACDTAGQASRAATREAGLTTGGGSALDGLVRAFIGAGGRSVVASHWPAPDDFDATERLIAGLFQSSATDSVAEAMRKAEVRLMDEAATSHPYYWAGFAIVGDGAQQLLVTR
ncbi:CHAT domain-containing protein [Sphingomonas cavernae]|uniref:CHAT domain-containing protein n=2 Tax=Sphingomonas cavernae TaxID=2320861 RepID=A0A418WSE1_9SPHN|nr:CHAT domain-containing protein [Sphingomonas cavernae]